MSAYTVPRLASGLDRILIMEQGPLVERGDLAKLQRPGSALPQLMAAVRAVLALPTGH